MTKMKRLPDGEFEIMKVIWRSPSPITTMQIIEKLDPRKKWKPQTVLTMLVRLTEKEFLISERVGRERNYVASISEEEYLQVETGNFMTRYYGNSVGSLIKTMYDGQDLSQEDFDELNEWLEEKRKAK